MKKFKRFLALLTVAVLVMSMGMGAMATAPENPVNGAEYQSAYFSPSAESVDLIGHTFNVVQVVKADSYDADKGEYNGLSWGAQISDKGAALLTALKADTTLKDDFKDYVIDPDDVTETKPLFTAASFAAVIKDYTTSAKQEALIKVIQGLNLTGQEITVTENMSPVPLTAGIGLYMVDDTTAATALTDDVANASILMAVPGSNMIRIKVDKPTQDKTVQENIKAEWNEVSDYNIGDYVPYKITSKIPNAEKFDSYTMTFTDEMSSGLTFADTVADVAATHKLKITVGGTELEASQYTLTPSAQGFTLALPVKDAPGTTQLFTAGAAVEITFFGLLNENADTGTDGNTNKSKLTYSNNPDSSTSTAETPWDTVITFTYELDVEKVDGVTGEALPGAQFALSAVTGEHATKYAIVDENGVLTGWTETIPAADQMTNGALLVADQDGKFKVVGLDDGTYTLTEIKPPAGYNAIHPIAVVISGTTENGKDYTDDLHDAPGEALTALKVTVTVDSKSTENTGTINTGIVEMTVENNSGAALPETGGVGTTMFYIIGAALVIGAGVVLVSRRRMNVQ